MVDYTDNFRITLQDDDENPSTWGQVVNNQVIKMFEEAIGGVAVVNVAGSSDVDIASSVANGSTDTARHAVLELTGAVGADIELEVPSVERIYHIYGGHTGSNVTVKPTGGSTGIVISPGDKVILYTNGTSIKQIAPQYSQSELMFGANNLSDLDDASTARNNLGLGDIVTYDVGAGFNISGSTLNSTPYSPGMIMMWGSNTPPDQWELMNGNTIGNGASSATLANNLYEDLFNHLWAFYPDAIATVTGGRGASSSSDWSSGKSITIPNFGGRSPLGAGQGNTAEGGGLGTNRSAGTTGGKETHTLTENEIPPHNHDFPGVNSGSGVGGNGGSWVSGYQTRTTQNTGGGQDHDNMHPFFVTNYIIYSGV